MSEELPNVPASVLLELIADITSCERSAGDIPHVKIAFKGGRFYVHAPLRGESVWSWSWGSTLEEALWNCVKRLRAHYRQAHEVQRDDFRRICSAIGRVKRQGKDA